MRKLLESRLQHALVHMNLRRAVVLIVTVAMTIALAAAILERLIDPAFPTIGLALWWAIQTVTTVGYGDIVPESTVGRVAAGVLMLVGVSLIPLMTSAVVSILVAQRTRESHEQQARDLAEIVQRLDSIDRRLQAQEAGH